MIPELVKLGLKVEPGFGTEAGLSTELTRLLIVPFAPLHDGPVDGCGADGTGYDGGRRCHPSIRALVATLYLVGSGSCGSPKEWTVSRETPVHRNAISVTDCCDARAARGRRRATGLALLGRRH